MENVTALKRKIASFPRIQLAHLPTPLEKLDTLSRKLERYNIYVKRDDQTGLAFGGNKTRKLEFIMADVISQGADSVVTWAGVQSNWCRQTAAAAVKMGIRSSLVLFRRPEFEAHVDGNLLLDRMFDSSIQLVDMDEESKLLELKEVSTYIEEAVEREKKKGFNPYTAPIGGSLVEGSMKEPLGAIGYLNAFIEIMEQSMEGGIHLDSIVLATGSCGTHAGLLAGAMALSPDTRIIGISVSEERDTVVRYLSSITDSTFELLGINMKTGEESMLVFDDYLEEGYGVYTANVANALQLVAGTEGILLDPVYTGKAMSGFLDLLDKDYFREGENILFLHSGGTPALFPYRDDILSYLEMSD